MFSTRRRSLIALSSFAAYRKPGRRDDNGDGGNANAGGGAGSGAGQGGNTGGSGQQGGQSGGQQGGNAGGQGNGQSGTGEPQLVEQLPGWAQRVISDLRRENAAKRAGNNNGQGQQNNGQGQQNNDQQGNQNGTQQGQQNNDQAQRDDAIQAAQATARESVVMLAAYRLAGANGADPDLLVDSTAARSKLVGLDPTADDFSTSLGAAIKKAIDENPKLRQVQAAGRSGGEFTGGPGGSAKKDVGTGVDRLRNAYAANQQT